MLDTKWYILASILLAAECDTLSARMKVSAQQNARYSSCAMQDCFYGILGNRKVYFMKWLTFKIQFLRFKIQFLRILFIWSWLDYVQQGLYFFCHFHILIYLFNYWLIYLFLNLYFYRVGWLTTHAHLQQCLVNALPSCLTSMPLGSSWFSKFSENSN